MEWAWDKRKTKARTPERGLHEILQLIIAVLRAVPNGKIAEDDWLVVGRRFETCIRTLWEHLDEVNMEVDIQDYPRVIY